MPDKWEYPWYAAWDLAFHCVPLALVDSEFAKEQLILLLREWYMHPNGQLPAYEWAFGDVNPPVHAWAAWRVYKIEQKRRGVGDRDVPGARVPQAAAQLHLVGQPQGRRGQERLPGRLPRPRQHRRLRPQRAAADGRAPRAVRRHRAGWRCTRSTCWRSRWSWRGTTRAYEDVASKFWEHFLYIAHAMNGGRIHGGDGHDLWDEEDGFFYDVLHLPDDSAHAAEGPVAGRPDPAASPSRRSSPRVLDRLPGFTPPPRVVHRQPARPHRRTSRACGRQGTASGGCCRSSIATSCARVLRVMLDEREFLSPYGIRSLSQHPPRPALRAARERHDSTASTTSRPSRRTGLFGGNSNWRGPIWFPVNYLIIESLQKFHHYFGDDFTGRVPHRLRADDDLGRWPRSSRAGCRSIFLRDADGRRPVFGGAEMFQHDPHWRDLRALPRVLPRRQRRRRRRQPPDRLDGARRQAAAAER